MFDLAPCGVCPAFPVTREAVRSYRTFSPLVALEQPVYFLWHFPWDHSRFLLGTTLPCGVRTFLSCVAVDCRKSDHLPISGISSLRFQGPTIKRAKLGTQLLDYALFLDRNFVLFQLLVQITTRRSDFLRGFRNVPTVLL